MQYQETKTKTLYLLLLLLLLLLSSAIAAVPRKTGTLLGSMAYVDECGKKWLNNAPKATVEIEGKGRIKQLVSDEIGDYTQQLEKGKYCLKSARDFEKRELRFSSNQHLCFNIKPGQTTRFDVMLLMP